MNARYVFDKVLITNFNRIKAKKKQMYLVNENNVLTNTINLKFINQGIKKNIIYFF